MRHRIHGKQLCRDSEHRRAMLRNLAAALFEHGEIETTASKAKAVQSFAEKLITIAKKGTFSARRLLESRINDRLIHSWVSDPNVPDSKKDNRYFDLPDASEIERNRYGEVRKAPRLIQHVMTKIAPLYADRDGGYTRVVKLGRHRLGDGADLVLLQLVGMEEGPEIGGGTSRRREIGNNRAAFAARLRKARSDPASSAATATATAVAEDEPDEPEAAEAVAADPVPEAEAPDAQDTKSG